MPSKVIRGSRAWDGLSEQVQRVDEASFFARGQRAFKLVLNLIKEEEEKGEGKREGEKEKEEEKRRKKSREEQ